MTKIWLVPNNLSRTGHIGGSYKPVDGTATCNKILAIQSGIGSRGIIIATCTVLTFRGSSRTFTGALIGIFMGIFICDVQQKNSPSCQAGLYWSQGIRQCPLHRAHFCDVQQSDSPPEISRLSSNLWCSLGITVLGLDKTTTRLLAIGGKKPLFIGAPVEGGADP